jgi:sugar O-acyltransferase (sialic acid O-acetyltransferase NeuD family)
MTPPVPPRLVIWGGTGQAKVMRAVAEDRGARVVAVFDDTTGLAAPFGDIPLLHGSAFSAWMRTQDAQGLGYCVAIGNPHGGARLRIHERLLAAGLAPATLIHRTAWISPHATIGAGAQIHAGAIVETGAVLGRQCIINTKASVDHECSLGDGVELAPGATLCGSIRVGDRAWICAGATVLPRITIGADAVVGAGAVVIRDVADGATVVGTPAAPITGANGRKR